MNYLWAFVIGGLLCAAAQVLIDRTGATPGRILVGYVVAGVVLGGLGIFGWMKDFAGAGVTVPLIGFGALIAAGVREAVEEVGCLGILTGGLTASSAGIAGALLCGLAAAVVFRPSRKR